jgi:glutamate racemase
MLYRRVLERYGGSAKVITAIAPELVTLAENGAKDTPEGEAIIRHYVEPMLDAGADQIVLACTHFPFLADTIERIAGSRLALVDPCPAVARQTARVWPRDAKPAEAPNTFFTTGNPEDFRAMLKALIGVNAPVRQLCWNGDYGAERMTELSLVERLST